ncbi:MAG: FAD-binding protein [Hyphomicrobiales bacterium]|nr:FAD-binding protein [Hyphomicrobiales bacterium]MBV9427125.1 FAD-binding protein [Bradyrhizobiaceae bacterium]
MADTLRPCDAKDVAAAIEWAAGEGKTLEIVGLGSKRRIGRAAQWDLTLDLSSLTGVTLYEPEELVLSARAGTPIADIEALIGGKGQELAFEPMDCGPLFGAGANKGTLGGVLAANVSGPRRIKSGAARDHFLGVSAVSGRGETFKSGGRVVKNVTGYDLCKVLAGSWGTLAAMTDVTIKVLPKAETEQTLIAFGLDDRTAVKAMAAALGSPGDVSAAAHIPASVAPRVAGAAAAGRAVTALRLEGVGPSIAARRAGLEALLKPYGELIAVSERSSHALWQAVRDVTPFEPPASGPVPPLWRISTAPARGPEIAAQVAAQCEAEALYDWGGGLVWMQIAGRADAGARFVRRAIAACGGHATLYRAEAAMRASVDVFEPQDPALAALTGRVKEGFDPKGILGPGRMYAGT